MAENKTQKTGASVTAFLDTIADEKKRKDAYTLVAMMQKAAKAEPEMWGSSIVGFGNLHYIYDSGRETDSGLIGFSPRKANLTLYVVWPGWDTFEPIKDLGKFTVSKSCLYIKTLDDVNIPALKKVLAEAVKASKKMEKEMAKKKKK
jgi:hypothetical protein